MPREKIQKNGASSLSSEELIAVILGSGCHDCDVFELSRKLSQYLSSASSRPTLENLLKIRGLGRVKASQILACLELSGRYLLGDKALVVKRPEDLLARLAFMKYETQECFVVVTLDAANHVIRVHQLTRGLVNQTPVHPREAFSKAIEDNAVSVIFAHNHPSGSTVPSPEDIGITRILCAAGKIIQIPVLDHLVVGKGGFSSICRNHPYLFENDEFVGKTGEKTALSRDCV